MKTAVLTGGNSGIGKATAIELAKKGYRIIIHGKDPDKTKKAAEEIKTVSGNNNIDFISADVSTLRGMKQLADAIKQKTDTINALVLSTGVILPKHILTEDGLEMGFVIQYLSRFAVTQLLMPELKKGNAKIVMVGAPIIKGATIHFEDLALKNKFTMIKAMAQEMLANHLFVQEFAKRHSNSGVVINMGNPGVVKTGITRNSNIFFRIMLSLFGASPKKTTANFVFLATDDIVNFSGYFLKQPGNTTAMEKIAQTPYSSEKLWDVSMELIKPILN